MIRARFLNLLFVLPAMTALGCFSPSPVDAGDENAKEPAGNPPRRALEDAGSAADQPPPTTEPLPKTSAPPVDQPALTRVRYKVVPLKAEMDLRETRARAIAAINDRLLALNLVYAEDFDVMGVGRAGNEVEVVLRTTDSKRVNRAMEIIEAPGSIEPCFFLSREMHDILTRSAPPSSTGRRWTLERRRVGFRENGGGEKAAYITPDYTQVLVKVPRDFSLRSTDWQSIAASEAGLAFVVAKGSLGKWRAHFEPHRGSPVGFSVNGVLRFIGAIDEDFLKGAFTIPSWTDPEEMGLIARVLRTSTLDARLERISR